MCAVEIAAKIVELQKKLDSDFYSVFFQEEETHKKKIMMQILTERGKAEYQNWLSCVTNDKKSPFCGEAGKITEELRNKELVPPEDMQPFVYIDFSEHSEIEGGDVLILSEAVPLFGKLDYQEYKDKKENGTYGYCKTQFELVYLSEGELCTYQGRQDFGDGDGDLFEHIEKSYKYYQDTEEGRDFLNNMSKEEADKIYENSRYVLEEFLPTMRYFCNLDKIEKAVLEERKIEDREPIVSAQSTARTYYHKDLLRYVKESRIALNNGAKLPLMPDIRNYVQNIGLESYKKQVLKEVTDETELYGIGVKEYIENAYTTKRNI